MWEVAAGKKVSRRRGRSQHPPGSNVPSLSTSHVLPAPGDTVVPRSPRPLPLWAGLGSLQHIYNHQEGDIHSPAQGFPSLALLGLQRGTAIAGLEGSTLAAELMGAMAVESNDRLAVAEAPRRAVPTWPPRELGRTITSQRAWKPG